MSKKVFFIAFNLLICFVFIDFVSAETYNNYVPDAVSCGNGLITDIPALLPKVVSIAYNILLVAIPVVLVIMGSLDLFKGITSQKEDEIKKGQQMFIKRLISAALIFFVFMIVKLVISVVSDGDSANMLECAQCFINNECD